MKFAIIRERKNPPDRRVVFSPDALVELRETFPQAEIKVESSPIRVFTDDQYREKGFEVSDDVSDCDVFLGVKEVPIASLIPGKKYFFFSHTIKEQPHNQKLIQAILEKQIDLYDHETVVNEKHVRLIGFGRYAGIVGAYNGLRAFGIKYELFDLPKAETLHGQAEMETKAKRVMLPPIKIVLTGFGKVGKGAQDFLDAIKIRQVSAEDFLNKRYSDPVYTHIDVLDYNKRIDGQPGKKADFYEHPGQYESDFEKFSKVADIFMAGHFYGNGAPVILSREALRKADNKIKVVADISCDVDGPIASTIRSSTIADPLYGYSASEDKEVDVFHPSAIVVMAVDNLPCELPKEASEGFGRMFLDHVMPAFFNNDKDGVLERALITKNGQLTPHFSYLEAYAHQEVAK